MYRIYKPLIAIYFYAIRLTGLIRKDAAKWIDGRIAWKENLKNFVSHIQHRHDQRIWFHVSSLGEFEQGRELIELIRKNHPQKIIILSFFSPSGFDKCKQYQFADYICYFPSDIYSEINAFIKILNPSLVIFVKYDFWFNTLKILNSNSIPYVFISTVFRKNHYLLSPVFHSMLKILQQAEQIFLQDENSYQLLQRHNFTNIQVAGDTRLDRVYRISEQAIEVDNMNFFCDREKIFIAGSIWKSDLEVITSSINKALRDQWKVILVPHQTDEATIRVIEKIFEGLSIRYSSLNSHTSKSILIIDRIGLLSRLYQYCLFAYIGGGFGKGIHNILEPASHKIPVCFGPKFQKFPEAKHFLENGIGNIIRNPEDLNDLFIAVMSKREQVKNKAETYFRKNLGASQKIFQYLDQHLL